MPAPRICVVGASNLDLISYVPRLPARGETLHGSVFQTSYGGKGANQAIMAARLGAEVSLVARVGDDAFGRDMMRNFAEAGLDTRHVAVSAGTASGVAPIVVDAEGNNTIVIVEGANGLLCAEDVTAAAGAIGNAGVLVCQLEIPLEATLAALRIARAGGVTTVLNPAPARPGLPEELFALVDILCPNEGEAAALAGLPAGDPGQALAAAKHLLDRGVRQVIVTLGERGSLLATPAGTVHVAAEPVKAIDSTGAGDAFVGSLAYFVARRLPLPEAVARANHIAGRSVTRRGAQPSFPRAADLPPEWTR